MRIKNNFYCGSVQGIKGQILTSAQQEEIGPYIEELIKSGCLERDESNGGPRAVSAPGDVEFFRDPEALSADLTSSKSTQETPKRKGKR
jgi:hypothetical protein